MANKRVLIISPHFPPLNAADMHRVRMSLWFFPALGWDAEVVTVYPRYSDIVQDELLNESIPEGIPVHYVTAFSKKWTAKFGLGSLALRSLWFYKKKVNQLLKSGKFDLVYFSTTQFQLTVLGGYWKKKFNIPYVIDMQDPWHSDYYRDKPKAERPRKYWLSYRMNKYLEPIAMKNVSGIISVSSAYIDTLKQRYTRVQHQPAAVITFSAFERDFEIAAKHSAALTPAFEKHPAQIHLVYVGRGGFDMQKAATVLFTAFKQGLENEPDLFSRVRFHFIGTSYAPQDQQVATFLPVATQLGVGEYVEEQTGRVGFYQSICTLQAASGLIIPGSDDAKYTASKIYPYILAKRPVFAVLHPAGSAGEIIRNCKAGEVITLDTPTTEVYAAFRGFIATVTDLSWSPATDWSAFKPYSAAEMSKKQVALFNQVVCDR